MKKAKTRNFIKVFEGDWDVKGRIVIPSECIEFRVEWNVKEKNLLRGEKACKIHANLGREVVKGLAFLREWEECRG